MPFPPDETYAEVNFGAHRKPAPQIGTPALAQHLAFWKPGDVSREDWHRSIDYLLFRIFMRLSDEFLIEKDRWKLPATAFLCPNLETNNQRLYLCRHSAPVTVHGGQVADSDQGNVRELSPTGEKERSVRYELFSIRTPFRGMDLKMRAELRNEFWTLTFIGDFSRQHPNNAAPGSAKTFRGAFVDLGEFFSRRAVAPEPNEGRHEASEEEIQKMADVTRTLYEDFYNLLSTQIVDPCINGFPEEKGMSLKNIGGVFADFRGAIFGIRNCPSRKGETGPLEATLQFINPATSQPHAEVALNSEDSGAFDRKASLKIIESLWPAFRLMYYPKEMDAPGTSKPEITATHFQKRRAIYVSSLGRVRHSPFSRSTEPVRYTIIPSYQSRWQVGRLVERIHNLGTLRLAAIQDIASLQRASDALRDLYDEWQKAKRDSKGEVDADSFASELEALGADIKSGLTFRIERSAYYVRSFDEVLGECRISRIEGFQPYEDFVRRRMGGAFEFIQRIGLRYNELRREIELSLERQRTNRMINLQETAVEITRKMSAIDEKISEATQGMTATQRHTNILLERAEIFLALGVTGIVYYGGSILFESAYEIFEDQPLGPPQKWWFFVLVFVGVLISLALLRKRRPFGWLRRD